LKYELNFELVHVESELSQHCMSSFWSLLFTLYKVPLLAFLW